MTKPIDNSDDVISINWDNMNSTITSIDSLSISDGTGLSWTTNTDPWTTSYEKALHVKGDAEFEGDIKIQGQSLVDTIKNIEKRLAILHPNPELEEKWERLKALGDMYRELEAEIIEKESVWSILKK
jgi:hypothetical protein